MAQYDKTKRSVVKHQTRKPFGVGGPSKREQENESGNGYRGPRGQGQDPHAKKRGSGGFRVGPKNVADGAYLGKVKRIKADLIANAKTKKRFYKDQQRQSGLASGDGAEAGPSSAGTSLGRFAPEGGSREGQATEGVVGRRPGGWRGRGNGGGQEEDAEGASRRRSRAGPAPGDDDEDDDEDDDAIDPAHADQASQARPKQRQSGGVSLRPSLPPAPSADPHRKTHRSREEALEARQARREKWNRTSGSAQGKKRGQPDLNGRMEVLLGQLEAGRT